MIGGFLAKGSVSSVNRGPQSGPVRPVAGSAGPAGKQAADRDSRLKISAANAAPQIGLSSKARSASVAAAPPTGGGAASVGGRPVRMRQTPSALNDFEHQAGVKIPIPAGKMCDTCKVKPAAFPDKNDWNCAECQFKE